MRKKAAVSQINSGGSTILKPVFLDNAEKTDLNIKTATKVQVIKRSPEGKVMLYKVINNDNDIVTDSTQLTPTPTHVKN